MRDTQKHLHALSLLLMDFYKFLEDENKPADEQVRKEFIAKENKWKRYCSDNQLTKKAYLLFNQEIGRSWNTRYANR